MCDVCLCVRMQDSEHHTHHSSGETKPHPAVQVITGPTPTVGVSDRTAAGQLEDSTARHVQGMHMYISPGNRSV